MEKDKKFPKQGSLASHDQHGEPPRAEHRPTFSSGSSESEFPGSPSLSDLYQKMPDMRRPRPTKDAMAAALEAVLRLAAEADAEDSAAESAEEAAGEVSARLCPVCGYRNREGNKFCAMCGLPVQPEAAEARTQSAEHLSETPPPYTESAFRSSALKGASPPGTHHYHHHYHHHYFPAGGDNLVSRQTGELPREPDKLRSSAILRGESMSRAEAAVWRITQEWVLACNTKHLDDLLDLYVADALVLRSNYPPVRGAAAIREFFFGALDAGLGEVEVDPVRVEIDRDMAYEAGRCKALVPGAAGKRREERGKYLWVFARQSNGEWKLAADCWSSDLTLATAESDVTPAVGTKPSPPRKSA